MDAAPSVPSGGSRPQPGSRLPYLARRPWVGCGIVLACALLFALLTWQVRLPNPALLAWDAAAARSVFDWAGAQPPAVVLFMRFWSAYGRDGVALVGFILLFAWARRGARRLLWLLVFGFFGTELWFQVLSNLINRARPEYKDPFETLISAGYPSGHVSTNFVLGGMILYLLLPRIRSPLRRLLLALAVAAAVTLIGFSRLFLGLHYITDIIAGLLFGLGWGVFVLTVTEWYFSTHPPFSMRGTMNH